MQPAVAPEVFQAAEPPWPRQPRLPGPSVLVDVPLVPGVPAAVVQVVRVVAVGHGDVPATLAVSVRVLALDDRVTAGRALLPAAACALAVDVAVVRVVGVVPVREG